MYTEHDVSWMELNSCYLLYYFPGLIVCDISCCAQLMHSSCYILEGATLSHFIPCVVVVLTSVLTVFGWIIHMQSQPSLGLMSYCRFCSYTHPVNSQFTIWHLCLWHTVRYGYEVLTVWCFVFLSHNKRLLTAH